MELEYAVIQKPLFFNSLDGKSTFLYQIKVQGNIKTNVAFFEYKDLSKHYEWKNMTIPSRKTLFKIAKKDSSTEINNDVKRQTFSDPDKEYVYNIRLVFLTCLNEILECHTKNVELINVPVVFVTSNKIFFEHFQNRRFLSVEKNVHNTKEQELSQIFVEYLKRKPVVFIYFPRDECLPESFDIQF